MPNPNVTAPLHTPTVRRFKTRFAARVRKLATKLPFLARLLNRLYDLYPDAAYLATLRPQNATAATQLGRVADSLSGIAQTVSEVYGAMPRTEENFNWVIDTMQENLCNKCARRAACWSKHYGDLIDAFYDLKPILAQTEHVGVEHFTAGLSHCVHPAAMASELTRAYALYRGKSETRVQGDTLRTALAEQYGAVAEALESLSAQLSMQGTPEHYKTRRMVELFTELGMPPSECAVTQELNGSLRVAITLPRTGFTEGELQCLAQDVSRVCRRVVDVPQKLSCRGVTTLIFGEKPALRAAFGVAFRPAKGDVSGDAVQQFCHANSAHMVLCDGMGTGRPAAVDGNLAAELTARLLRAGFSAETAARLVNIALALKGEEESSATLDLISVDLYTGVARLFKAGAAPGFVLQNGRCTAVCATSLPVGILGQVTAAQTSVRLQLGDIAVLVSDGMLQKGEGWLQQKIAQVAGAYQTPQEIAQALVKQAHAYMAAEQTHRPDDITVAVLQLVRNP